MHRVHADDMGTIATAHTMTYYQCHVIDEPHLADDMMDIILMRATPMDLYSDVKLHLVDI